MARLIPNSLILSSLLAFFLVNSGEATNLVTNSGFETGNFSGWTTTTAATGSSFGVGTTDPHTGSYSAWFADPTVGKYDSISQSISTLPSETFQLTFWLAVNTASISPLVKTGVAAPLDAPPPTSIDDFQVLWNGDVIGDFSTSKVTQYSEYTMSLPAAGALGASTELTFQAYNSGLGTYLDDISLTPLDATPEPRTLCLISLALVSVGLFRVVRKIRSREV